MKVVIMVHIPKKGRSQKRYRIDSGGIAVVKKLLNRDIDLETEYQNMKGTENKTSFDKKLQSSSKE